MDEKNNPISKIKLTLPLRTQYNDTKDLDTCATRTTSGRTTLFDTDQTRQISRDDPSQMDDHPGIPTIKKLNQLPRLIDHDLKSPKHFEELVENMTERYIPAILIAPTSPCTKILVFYHANAEDIGQAYSFCKDLNEKLEVHPL